MPLVFEPGLFQPAIPGASVATHVNPDVSSPEWSQAAPTLAVKAKSNDAVSGVYQDGVLLNPLSDAPSGGARSYLVCAPPGATALQFSLTAMLPSGVGASIIVLAVYDVTGVTILGSQLCVLTSTQTQYSVTAPVVSALEYQVQIVVNNTSLGTTAQAQADVSMALVTFTGATGVLQTGAFVRIPCTPVTMRCNNESSIPTARGWRFSPFSFLSVVTGYTTLLIEMWTPNGTSIAQNQILVRVNGRPYALLTPTNLFGLSYVPVTLPSGSNRVDIVTSGTSAPGAATIGTFPRAIYAPQNAVTVLGNPHIHQTLMVYGDSIAIQYTTTPAAGTIHAAFNRILSAFPGEIVFEAYSGRALNDENGTAAGRATFVAKCARHRPDIVWIEIGTNDWGTAATTSAVFGTNYAAILDGLHAALPAATIYCQTPVVRANENTANANGDRLADFRYQIGLAVSTRSWATLVAGTEILTLGDLVDGIHPTDVGSDKYARYVTGTLGLDALPSPFTLAADFTGLVLGAVSQNYLQTNTGLLFQRSDSNKTVQTGASTVVDSGFASNVAGIGSTGAAWGQGLSFDESRTNLCADSINPNAASWSAASSTNTGSYTTAPDGNNNGVRIRLNAATGVISSFYSAVSTNGNPYTYSQWQKQGGAATAYQLDSVSNGVVGGINYAASTPTVWTRISASRNAAAVTVLVVPLDGATQAGGSPSNFQGDIAWWGLNIEAGQYPTEFINTAGGTLTRAGERLSVPSGTTVVDGGRLGLYVKFIPKGALSAYPGNVYLWNIDANNYAYVATSGNVTVSIGGTVQTLSTSPIVWASGDVVELWIEAGGGSLATYCSYRRNAGVMVIVGTNATALGTVASNSTPDTLCNGTSNQLTSWIQQVRYYRIGLKPYWA